MNIISFESRGIDGLGRRLYVKFHKVNYDTLDHEIYNRSKAIAEFSVTKMRNEHVTIFSVPLCVLVKHFNLTIAAQ